MERSEVAERCRRQEIRDRRPREQQREGNAGEDQRVRRVAISAHRIGVQDISVLDTSANGAEPARRRAGDPVVKKWPSTRAIRTLAQGIRTGAP